MQIGKLDNPIIKTEIYAFDLKENERKLKNRYIQVFSKKAIYLGFTFTISKEEIKW